MLHKQPLLRFSKSDFENKTEMSCFGRLFRSFNSCFGAFRCTFRILKLCLLITFLVLIATFFVKVYVFYLDFVNTLSNIWRPIESISGSVSDFARLCSSNGTWTDCVKIAAPIPMMVGAKLAQIVKPEPLNFDVDPSWDKIHQRMTQCPDVLMFSSLFLNFVVNCDCKLKPDVYKGLNSSCVFGVDENRILAPGNFSVCYVKPNILCTPHLKARFPNYPGAVS